MLTSGWVRKKIFTQGCPKMALLLHIFTYLLSDFHLVPGDFYKKVLYQTTG